MEITCHGSFIRTTLLSGTLVYALTATDADATSALTYRLDSSSQPSSYETYFSVSGGNTITLITTVDLDTPVSAEDLFYLVVTVTDGGSPERTGTTTVIVSVEFVNEEAPVFAESTYIVNEVSSDTSLSRV